jgi:hypothetical protein
MQQQAVRSTFTKTLVGEPKVPHHVNLLREGTQRTGMKDTETYRTYADDCRRIAEKMTGNDKAALLRMADLWDKQADEAGRRGKNNEDGSKK